MYPKWLPNDPIVIPKAKLSPKLHHMTPKSNQSDPNITPLAELFAALAPSGPSWTSKILSKNVYFLFTSPLRADNATIKPATTRIIPAIRRVYAQSPKMTPESSSCAKKSQSGPQIDPQFTPSLP